MAFDSPIREPDQIRHDAAFKLRQAQVSDDFRAILGCLLGQQWTSPRLEQILVSPEGHMIGRLEGNEYFSKYFGTLVDLLKDIHIIARLAGLDGDEAGYLVAKAAEIKRQR